jgi:dsDNA-specific endonuclease/ATPase MutS2
MPKPPENQPEEREEERPEEQEDEHDHDGPESQPVALAITDVLDLHTFRPAEVSDAVRAYLPEARQRGFQTVRIIHGKGIGVQRERVRAVLSQTPYVARYQDAPMGAGSWGATIAWLRLLDQNEDDIQ